MGNRLSTITTRTGDDGTTGLADSSRLSKNDPRVHAMGEVDELNSHLGLILTEPLPERLNTELTRIQHDLFDLGAALSMPKVDELFPHHAVERMESLIKEFNAPLPRLEEFILPGGSRASAYMHIARTVCRRAERVLVDLNQKNQLPKDLLLYMNRLSDFLFIAARWIHYTQGVHDVQWKKGFNNPN